MDWTLVLLGCGKSWHAREHAITTWPADLCCYPVDEWNGPVLCGILFNVIDTIKDYGDPTAMTKDIIERLLEDMGLDDDLVTWLAILIEALLEDWKDVIEDISEWLFLKLCECLVNGITKQLQDDCKSLNWCT